MGVSLNPFASGLGPTADAINVTADAGPTEPVRRPAKPVAYYLERITAYHRGRARFAETVRFSVAPSVEAADTSLGVPAVYDLDDAVGVQLDAVGAWVGRSRAVPVPLTNLFFSFGIASLGFGRGIWKSPLDAEQGVSFLPDETYRKLIRAKILANRWDGTAEGAEAILGAYFDDYRTHAFIDDRGLAVTPIAYLTFGDPERGFGMALWHGDTGATSNPDSLGLETHVGISGKIPDPIDLAVLGNDLIPVKPMGARTRYAVTTVDRAPLFGFGAHNDRIAGFGSGAWGNSPAFVADLIGG